jgi:hypothetical protein
MCESLNHSQEGEEGRRDEDRRGRRTDKKKQK